MRRNEAMPLLPRAGTASQKREEYLQEANAGGARCADAGITPEQKQRRETVSLSKRHWVFAMSVYGFSFRRIARMVGVDHKTVIHWVKTYADQLPPASVLRDLSTSELDELLDNVDKNKTPPT